MGELKQVRKGKTRPMTIARGLGVKVERVARFFLRPAYIKEALRAQFKGSRYGGWAVLKKKPNEALIWAVHCDI